jgi:hypothetical protein
MSTAQNTGAFLKEANHSFETGHFRTALRLYRQGGWDHSKNKNIRLRVGICLYEINDVDNAISVLNSLQKEGKTDENAFLYLGKCYQAKNSFANAILNYKKFIAQAHEDHPQYAWAKDELTRCANGERMKYGDELAYVENAGTTINTQYNEFGVRISPTKDEKIYFNTDKVNGETSEANVDIFSASVINGRWTDPVILPAAINTKAYEEVSGFSEDGQVIYFLTPAGNEFKIKTDTFSEIAGELHQGIFNGPYVPDGGGTDLFFFNDTICLYAADISGGYGGYDLYISVWRNGSWSKGTNLGPVINSFYDERFPFLSINGQTLFFSSDNLESIGGFDVFRADFNPFTLAWSTPVNPGFPVNSTLDDTYFVLSSDGMTGFISSDRKEGYGGQDIYRVFFKQPIVAQTQPSPIPTFFQMLSLRGMDQIVGQPEKPAVEVKEYFLSHLFIEEKGEILTPQNIKKLDLLANLMMIYPKITAELSGFELPKSQSTYTVYFSIKNVEKAAAYLEQKGVSQNRLNLKGYGSSFPLALNTTGSQNNIVFLKLNHRMEIGLHNMEGEPVLAHIEKIPVPENLRDPGGEKFSFLRHEMYYSVQIASLNQILQNPDLASENEMFIEVENGRGYYKYMTGMFPTYALAEKKLNQMIGIGFTDAFIVPYLDGIRIRLEDIPGLALKYPDLLTYLEKTKK